MTTALPAARLDGAPGLDGARVFTLSMGDQQRGIRGGGGGPGRPAETVEAALPERGGTETTEVSVPGGSALPELLDRETLFAGFQPLVRRLIRQYGEDAEMRQDLIGEIYCRFCRLVDAYDPSRGIPLRPYLVRTLTASVYTYARSYWRRQQREVSLGLGADEDASSLADPSLQWGRQLMMEELLAALPTAIARLPTRQRNVLIWRYYEARSFEEIAGLLQVRPATARSLLRHGIKNLRQRINEADLGFG
jgi:RNA polymerase sigma-70 factor (ECF subfamily)